MKKLCSVLLAFLMVLSLGTVAFAATELPAADVNGVITLTEDVTLSSSYPVNGTLTIDLAGFDITGTDTTSANFALISVKHGGNLTVTDSVGGGSITLTATNNRGWNSYSAVLDNNQGTLSVDGVTIKHLGGTDMAYGIDNLTNGGIGDAILTVTDSTVTSTYRSIRQFANSSTCENNVTVTNSELVGTFWVQSPNTSANNSETIINDTTVDGNGSRAIYVYAPAGGDASNLDFSADNIEAYGPVVNATDNDAAIELTDATIIDTSSNTDGAQWFPGEKVVVATGIDRTEYKVKSYDFTTGTKGYNGASYIDEVKIEKNGNVVIILKESYTLAKDRVLKGEIVLVNKSDKNDTITIDVEKTLNNKVEEYISGGRKASEAESINGLWENGNTVLIMDEDGGYVSFSNEMLKGTVKMNKEEKTFLNVIYGAQEETLEAIEELLGEEYLDEAIIEYYEFETRAFKNEVAFSYEAYEDDPHFFYLYNDGKLTKIDAVYNDDEEVEAWEWTAIAEGTIIVTDVEIVLADEEATKNPDTGANDVVGIAAALAVTSLVAAAAISIKK